MTSSAAILACIAAEQPMTIVYQDAHGIISVRVVLPHSVERCANGNSIMRCYDLQRKAPRSFTLHRIQRAEIGGHKDVTIQLSEPNRPIGFSEEFMRLFRVSGCTGTPHTNGEITHNGDTCPIHEA